MTFEHMEIDAGLARQEVEMNVNWMRENPDLATRTILKFHDDFCQQPFKTWLDVSRKGFITLYAERLDK